jgi:hypothetical protein
VLIEPPDAADTRSVLADWLELTAALTKKNKAGRAELFAVLDFLEDKAAEAPLVDDETGAPLDREILDEPRESLFVDVFDELAYRAKTLANSYPFEIHAEDRLISFRFDGEDAHPGQTVYLFCLIVTAIREDHVIFGPPELMKRLVANIANAFQVCACVAAGGYVGGSVASFGFPRASGNGFHAALQQVYKRFGAGTITARDEIPEGLPTMLKDGGIDVIAWRDLPDRMPGKFYLIGQCASGLNWREKSVVSYIGPFHGAWFTQKPAENSFPAMFIPFPLQHDLGTPRHEPFLQTLHNRFWYEEMAFGIVFDRIRICWLVGELPNRGASYAEIEGIEQFGDVRDWVLDAITAASAIK